MDVEPPLQIIGWDFVLLHLLGSIELFLGSRALTEVVQLAALCRSSSLIAQMEYQKISEEQGIVGLPSGQEIGILSNIHRLDFVSLDRLRARFFSRVSTSTCGWSGYSCRRGRYRQPGITASERRRPSA